MSRGGLSALQRAILGLVQRMGPVTPYALRKVFERSPSSHWSGSAGAIYPAVRRLEAEGLIEGAERSDDARGSVEYRITRAGRRDLRAWLESEIEAEEASYVFDPIRLRILFIDTLPAERRRAVVDDALDKLREQLDVERGFGEAMDREGIWGAVQANQGAVLVLRARIEWLEGLRRAL